MWVAKTTDQMEALTRPKSLWPRWSSLDILYFWGPGRVIIPLRKLVHLSCWKGSENDIFPLSRHFVFWFPLWPFCLNSSLFCSYFTFLLPLFSLSFPFPLFSFSFLPFSFTFSPCFSLHFHIFSPNDIGWYFSLPPGGEVFFLQYLGPCGNTSRCPCLYGISALIEIR